MEINSFAGYFFGIVDFVFSFLNRHHHATANASTPTLTQPTTQRRQHILTHTKHNTHFQHRYRPTSLQVARGLHSYAMTVVFFHNVNMFYTAIKRRYLETTRKSRIQLGAAWRPGSKKHVLICSQDRGYKLTNIRDSGVQLHTRTFRQHLKSWNQQTTKIMNESNIFLLPTSYRQLRKSFKLPLWRIPFVKCSHNTLRLSQADPRYQRFQKQFALEHLQLSCGGQLVETSRANSHASHPKSGVQEVVRERAKRGTVVLGSCTSIGSCGLSKLMNGAFVLFVTRSITMCKRASRMTSSGNDTVLPPVGLVVTNMLLSTLFRSQPIVGLLSGLRAWRHECLAIPCQSSGKCDQRTS